MKALSYPELTAFLEMHRGLVDGRLQEVMTTEVELGLGIYSRGSLNYIWFDLTPALPCVVLFASNPRDQLSQFIRVKDKPVGLFLKAHARNRILREWRIGPENSRLYTLVFGNEGDPGGRCSLEVRLFPHGQNAIVTWDHKSISWNKPKPLIHSGAELTARTLRDPAQWAEEWFEKKTKFKQKKSRAGPRVGERSEIDLIAKLRRQHEDLLEKINQNKLALNPDHSLSPHDLNELYEQTKIFDSKAKRLAKRIDELAKKIAVPTSIELTANALSASQNEKQKKAPRKGIPFGSWWLVVGRSGKENLELLRESKPWHLWMHLKDFPGPFGLVHKNKQENIPPEMLKQMATELARRSLGQKLKNHEGDLIDVVICECRFVKPIKGDRLGRVSHHSGQVLRVRL